LNDKNLTNYLLCSRWACLPVAMLFFFSGHGVKADPVGDFFKKVGHSISKAFEPQPEPNHTSKKTTKRAGRRTSSARSDVAGASPTPIEQPTVVAQQQKVNPTVTLMRASAAPPEKAKGDLPYGIPVSGQKGIVTSPYLPEGGYIDVRAFAPGSAVRDPYTRKIFLVP
jgi:hypothetical protein